jgi:predicted cupin superfamily sugar epimerase
MDVAIEFSPSAFKHNVSEADIRWAFDTAVYDGWFNEGKDKDRYLLIGFDRKGNPLEILYYFIDDETINVFHAMKCRSIYHHLIRKEGNYGKND